MSEGDAMAATWTHFCVPPTKEGVYFETLPTHRTGEVWYCGCGQPYGVVEPSGRIPRWVPLAPGTPVNGGMRP